ncbi:response regulator [Micrococcoides hystricis]|uniref:Response regulator n=1 Tax=Micrococcoides hystricis TaxID=1572761 RepID=A0ABV6PB15_9MICC
MIRVMLTDDQAMVRGALAALLGLEGDLHIVAETANGQECLTAVEEQNAAGSPVDVVLLDVEMPVLDGLAACRQLKQRFPDTKVLMLTTFGRPGYVARALAAGADGFMVKDAPAEELAEAVRQVHAGKRVVDPSLAVESLSVGPSPLTERETEVLRAAASGCSIDEIAAQVHLSAGTVRNHISSIMTKTQARNRSEAARIATDNGWL